MKSQAIFAAAVLALTFTACSSKDKKTEAPKAAAPAVAATPTPAPAAPAVTTGKAAKAGKKAKKAAAAASSEATAAAGAVTCTKGSDSRTIEAKAQGNGCELVYTKNGEAKSVATARSGMDYCQAAATKLQTTLSNAGMSCN
jgi:hypothetical protein